MKKTLLFLGLASAMSALTGCTKDEVSDNGAVDKGVTSAAPQTLVAQTADGTRTLVDADGVSLKWDEYDGIMIAGENATEGASYTISSGGGSDAAVFGLDEGQDAQIAKLPYGKDVSAYVAISPVDNFVNEMNGPYHRVGSVIKKVQTPTLGSYDPMSYPMMALMKDAASGEALKFKPMAALIRFSLKDNQNLKQIVVENLEGETQDGAPYNLVGKIAHQFAEDVVSVKDWDKTYRDPFFFDFNTPMDSKVLIKIGDDLLNSSSVTMTGNMPMSTTEAADYYTAIYPRTYTKLYVQFTQADNSIVEKVIHNIGDLNAGSVLKMPEADLSAATYIPAPAMEGSVINWTADENVAGSYNLQIKLGKKVLTTITKDVVPGMDFDVIAAPVLDEFTGDAYAQGDDVELSLRVKAIYKDEKIAEAVYSAPISYTWTVRQPEIVSTWIASNSSTLLTVMNFPAFEKIEYCRIDTDSENPDDFTNFTTMNSKYGIDWGITTADFGHFSLMVKATLADGTVKTKFHHYNHTETILDPGLDNIALTGRCADMDILLNFDVIADPDKKGYTFSMWWKTYTPTAATLKWHAGDSADFSGDVSHDALPEINKAVKSGESISVYSIDSSLPVVANDAVYSVEVTLSGDKLGASKTKVFTVVTGAK